MKKAFRDEDSVYGNFLGIVGSSFIQRYSCSLSTCWLRISRRHACKSHYLVSSLAPTPARRSVRTTSEFPPQRTISNSSSRRPDRTTPIPRYPTSTQSVTMPSEVSDIKQFIEICRRKDAKCTFTCLPAHTGAKWAITHDATTYTRGIQEIGEKI
jgi:hypothetical protein